LEEELASLDFEEEQQAKQRKVASLRRSIEEKRAKIQAAKQLDSPSSFGIPLTDIAELKRQVPKTPLDGILQPLQQAAPNAAQCSDGTAMVQQYNDWQHKLGTSGRFLKPAQLPKGEKILRIVDFGDNIVPREDERTISDGGNTKLIVSYGTKKPKLEQVTLQQWVVSSKYSIIYKLVVSCYLSKTSSII